MFSISRTGFRIALFILVPSVALSCSNEPLAPEAVASICHVSGPVGNVLDVRSTELPEHRAHGDYPVRLLVDRNSSVVGDSVHFVRITDAIATARATRAARSETSTAACRITIDVAPGIYLGSVRDTTDQSLERFPLMLDMPDITLRGSLRMAVDAKMRATGAGEGTDLTVLAPTSGLLTVFVGGIAQNNRAEPIVVVNGHPEGPKGNGVVVEGFVFQSGNDRTDAITGGHGIFSLRVSNLVIRGNRFEGGFSEALDLRASTGVVVRNYLIGRGGSCGICLSGPGVYEAKDNRLAGPGGIPGLFVNATGLLPVPTEVEQYVPPPIVDLEATIRNNEVRNHQATPVGTAIRIGSIGPGAPGVAGVTKVQILDNDLIGNRFAIIVDAAFPVAGTALRGDVTVNMTGNAMSLSCQNNVLVSFSRHTTGLGLASAPYSRNSTFSLSGLNASAADVWYANPSGFGNTLTLDGQIVPPGSRHAYDAQKVCPA